MSNQIVNTSKFLSLVLRHRPERIGISLDPEGWVEIDVLLDAMNRAERRVDRAHLDEVVATNNKKRFAISDDGLRIRASQGHSIDVDLGLPPVTPPDVLFHGTVEKFIDSISRHGLQKRKRRHVHLSADVATAEIVGKRRGEPVVLQIDAKGMHENGHEFFISANKVWLTDHVPVEFIGFP